MPRGRSTREDLYRWPFPGFARLRARFWDEFRVFSSAKGCVAVASLALYSCSTLLETVYCSRIGFLPCMNCVTRSHMGRIFECFKLKRLFFFYLSFFTLLYLILKGFVFCFGIDRVTECDQYRCFPIICSLLLRAAKSEWLCVKWKTTFVLGTQRKIFVRSLKRRAQFAFLFHLNLFWVSKRKYSKKVTMQSKY